MWKFKHFSQKEQTGLEGRMLDVGSYKIQVRNVIAEGGFSCVYLARDLLNGSKQYALKHMICNDSESLELVMKEISVMKTLIGHPNVVYLHAHAIFDMGRTKEALLLMEYCEKSLISVLDGRGAGFFEEKQALTIFRDVCNAVFAMHCQNPPIAHRDLKAENLLLGHDGSWKLCDFGSTSTNHKRFEKPEEMGIEEDIIRKHTTPAYRAPEMWDLFRKEPINEKVDIWALGCLLYRICYLKLAFDGDSKLQVLNGNYRIPDLPKYNKSLTDLIRDMLQPSPVDRPDITQVWLRVNDLLPESIQKSLPDRPPEMPEPKSDMFAGVSNVTNNSSPAPRRSPPPPPSSARQASTINNSRASGNTEPLGSFWTTQHAKVDVTDHKTSVKSGSDRNTSVRKNSADYSVNKPSDFSSKDFDLFPEDLNGNAEAIRQSKPDAVPGFRNDAGNKQRPISNLQNTGKEMTLEAEVEKLKKQLANVTAEKADMSSKYEKLAAICRSQREEIQDLKHALAARTPSPQSRDSSRASTGSHSIGTPVNDKIQGTVLELQQAFFGEASPSTNSNQWHAFEDDTKPPLPTNNAPRSFRTKTNPPNNQPQVSPQPPSISSSWEFETGSFKVTPSPSSGEFKVPQRFGETKSTQNKLESQPAGWAGF